MVEELNVAGPLPVSADKLLIARRSFVLVIAREHALDAHTDALRVLDRAPTLIPQKIEAYDSVGVNVWMHGNRSIGFLVERDFWRLWMDGAGSVCGARAEGSHEGGVEPIGYESGKTNLSL